MKHQKMESLLQLSSVSESFDFLHCVQFMMVEIVMPYVMMHLGNNGTNVSNAGLISS